MDSEAQQQLIKNGQDKNIWKDLSGNGNDGELIGFDFTNESGWTKDGLKFNVVNNYLNLPSINIDSTDFTLQINKQIYSYTKDNCKTIYKNDVRTARHNLYSNSLLKNDFARWGYAEITNFNKYVRVESTGSGTNYGVIQQSMDYTMTYNQNTNYTLSFLARGNINKFDYCYLMRRESGNKIMPTKHITLNNDWKQVEITVNTGNWNTNSGYVLIGTRDVGNGKYFEVKDIKVEKNEKSTTWVPNVEDLTLFELDNNALLKKSILKRYIIYNRALADEEILQNYRATHFLLEPKAFTPTDYYNYYDINRVEVNTLATKDLSEILRGDIDLESINFDRDMKSFPFADILNKVERNIDKLGNELYKPKSFINPKLDWTPEMRFSYEDANRLESNLKLLYNYAKGNIDNFRYCGAYTSGEEVI